MIDISTPTNYDVNTQTKNYYYEEKWNSDYKQNQEYVNYNNCNNNNSNHNHDCHSQWEQIAKASNFYEEDDQFMDLDLEDKKIDLFNDDMEFDEESNKYQHEESNKQYQYEQQQYQQKEEECKTIIDSSDDSESEPESETEISENKGNPSEDTYCETYEDNTQNNMQETVNKTNVIIFDWDDTLLCSSYLATNGIELHHAINPEFAKHLKILEQNVINVLSTALQYGPVFIVTNAEQGWVELSAKKYIPGVLPLLSKLEGIVSARSRYEVLFPTNPMRWKQYAFKNTLTEYLNNTRKGNDSQVGDLNLLSFGDSDIERYVTLSYKNCTNTIVKTVKLLERVDVQQLYQELELVTRVFDKLFNAKDHLDLTINI